MSTHRIWCWAMYERIRYRVIRKPVKYARVELRGNEVWVIVPKGINPHEVIMKNRSWIMRQLNVIKRAEELAEKVEIIPRTRRKFRSLVEKIILEYSSSLKVDIKKVSIRKMRTSWGTCSERGFINISKLAQYLPEKLIRYLVYHEICHLLRWRHDEEFERLISEKFPDYGELDLELQAYWIKLNSMNKLP